METKQFFAVLGLLAFLGTGLALAACAVALATVKATGESRLQRWSDGIAGWIFGGGGLGRKILIVSLALAGVYSSALFAASLGSHEWNLEPGAEKYFCEIDCHIAYAVTSAAKTTTIAAQATTLKPQGVFYILSVRTRFDESTISPNRGDAPLTPSPRIVTMVDAAGNSYAPSQDAVEVLERDGMQSAPMTQDLRPGESYVSVLVFDLPAAVANPRLLIETRPGWPDKIFIGGEESLLHKKVFLRLPV